MTQQKRFGAMAVPRGCGDERTPGGIYLELGLDPNGLPMKSFLFDPPNYTLLEGGLHVPAVGAHLVEWAGVYHIFDHIGSMFYPNVTDWIEETARFGISRKLPLTLDYGLLTRESRLFVIHSKAYVLQPDGLQPYTCPTAKEHQHGAMEACIGACWHDLEAEGTTLLDAQTGACERTMPSFTYDHLLERTEVPVHRRPEGVQPLYKRAIFGKFPIGRLVIVGDPGDPAIEQRAKKVRRAKLPLDFVEE